MHVHGWTLVAFYFYSVINISNAYSCLGCYFITYFKKTPSSRQILPRPQFPPRISFMAILCMSECCLRHVQQSVSENFNFIKIIMLYNSFINQLIILIHWIILLVQSAYISFFFYLQIFHDSLSMQDLRCFGVAGLRNILELQDWHTF